MLPLSFILFKFILTEHVRIEPRLSVYVNVCMYVCVCVCTYVCVCVCVYGYVSAIGKTTRPILIKYHTHTLHDVYLCRLSHFLKNRIDDVTVAILYKKKRFGTLTS